MLSIKSKKSTASDNCQVFLTKGRFGAVRTWHYIKVNKLKLPLYNKALQAGEYGRC